jgi:hypothetical protein
MTKIQLLAGAILAIAAATPAAAQTIAFNSIPTSNTCAYPWALTMLPAPTITLAPGGAITINKTINGVQSPHPIVFVPPAPPSTYSPGTMCFFGPCAPGGLTLTCAPIGRKLTGAAAVNAVKASTAKTVIVLLPKK